MFIAINKEDFLDQARESTERYAKGATLGVLDGVPVAVKDEIDVIGYRTTRGTILPKAPSPAKEDSPSVARLRSAAAIIVGKTNMHDMGVGVTGLNVHYGTPKNPHNASHYTGGSSSGSAAAVACGIVPLALAVDGGGSIRIPAPFCGVVGLKPTFQRVPSLPTELLSVGHFGPIANSVRDTAIAYATISGSHESFPRGRSQPSVDFSSFDKTKSLAGLKIGYFEALANHSSPEVAKSVRRVCQELRNKGAKIIPVQLHHFHTILLAHALTVLSELASMLDQHVESLHTMGPDARIMMMLASHFSALELTSAQRVRGFALRQIQQEIFDKVDIFISPTTGITAPKISADALEYGEMSAEQISDILRFCIYANLVGVPGIAVRIGHDSGGLPLSVQFQARHWDEDVLFRVAHTTEQLYVSQMKRPQVYFSILDRAKEIVRDDGTTNK
uniref:GlutamyltRNA(Gln) amidotransferase subunit A putativ n=1 Tax=Albugo laibachii Nc14 TaxID=890382 RepID=F0W3B8_9STRA|nr:glutamyltRNA(Gln) amidotransferase subunit A putativ [Albugo laibachii Nc14]|eukprot:CCA15561.1 glutamyltRNA(Gln) amidotransferase subunit A putativ [Albugo laibachii Nc14]